LNYWRVIWKKSGGLRRL